MRLPDGTVRKTRKTYNTPCQAHEFTFTCRGRRRMLNSDRTRLWLIDAIERARRRHGFEIWAYVIMPEHAHLLIFPRSGYDASEILKSIKQSVSRRAVSWLRQNAPGHLTRLRVEWPGGRVEHRFWEQGGGHDRNMYTAKACWLSVEYLHMNPVRGGLVARPEDWEWSSARWYAGARDVPLLMDGRPPPIMDHR